MNWTMSQIRAAAWLATILLVGQTAAVGQVQLEDAGKSRAEETEKNAAPDVSQARNAETAKRKAEVLEEKAASEGNKVLPTPAQIITKPQAQAVDPTGEESLNDAITCLARSIYWEARGEGDAGMEAIANVIMNRVGHEGFPDTICGVVKQGHEQGACQFSWWCDGRSDDATEEEPYSHAKEIARKALNHQLKDRTGGALYFHNRKLVPDWSREYIRTVEVGEHVFYKPSGAKAR
jgi:spore germination cell wall hydrolase CwlJ-like protein